VTEPIATTAGSEGPDWSDKAPAWAELWAPLADPARELVARATMIGAGTTVLDVGCGSGEFCRLAAARGATVSGIDAADGMIDIARRRVPAADLRVGPMERLPWDDGRFDVVTAFNALQFAADFATALADATRVVRRGGLVAICNWARPEDCELGAVSEPLRALVPGSVPASSAPAPSAPDPPAVGQPGVLEDLARAAGLRPREAGEVDVPYEVPDQATLERAFLVDAGLLGDGEQAGVETARRTIVDAAAPFRRADGSYRFENRFLYLVAAA
jgi:SAM-dependent methyltransferase